MREDIATVIGEAGSIHELCIRQTAALKRGGTVRCHRCSQCATLMDVEFANRKMFQRAEITCISCGSREECVSFPA